MPNNWTPGPWEADGLSDPHYFPHVFLGPEIDGSRGRLVINEGPSPEQVARGCAIGTTGETADANARLIASAPALYEALDNCVNGLGCQPGYVNTLALQRALQALAASRGEEGEAPRPTLKRTPPALPVVHPAPVKI